MGTSLSCHCVVTTLMAHTIVKTGRDLWSSSSPCLGDKGTHPGGFGNGSRVIWKGFLQTRQVVFDKGYTLAVGDKNMLLPVSKSDAHQARGSLPVSASVGLHLCINISRSMTATGSQECGVNTWPRSPNQHHLTASEAGSLPIHTPHVCREGAPYFRCSKALLRLLLDHPLGLQIFGGTLTQKSSFRRAGIANQAGQHSRKNLWSLYNSRSGSFRLCQHFSKFLKACFFPIEANFRTRIYTVSQA